MHAFHPAHRSTARWLLAIVGSVALLLATPALSHAAEGEEGSNPNNYTCRGHISAGQPEAGSEEVQVQYTFSCNGPITGYQVQGQVPFTGVTAQPLVTDQLSNPLKDTFSCSSEIPGYAANCVGSTKIAYEVVTGQFAIGTKLCAEPRVDPLLTVTDAYLEKNVVTQAISGPFDLGRPRGCPADALSGSTRLEPKAPVVVHKKKHKKKHKGHKAKKSETRK